jgi:ATP-dependent exoDNAse (exonuclease V) beta subunit
MDLVGSAIHGFLAADRPGLDPGARLAIASGLLERWDVANAIAPTALLTASDALQAWVAHNWPAAVWHRELPILHRLPSGSTVRGTCDLALETTAGWVIIDHKSFPGTTADAVTRAQAHAPQLAAYAAAIRAATSQPIHSYWIHLPVTGLIIPVNPENPVILSTLSA